ncbi:MAG: hypothetical protein KKB82_09195 [Candidatus Omnitrophica bacterium]|nr:hypothetical protein [Candidatus Omnitrophota bacterium]MBU1926079.1 hypothetical protein [Candidatus Omnitrophota bacterium]
MKIRSKIPQQKTRKIIRKSIAFFVVQTIFVSTLQIAYAGNISCSDSSTLSPQLSLGNSELQSIFLQISPLAKTENSLTRRKFGQLLLFGAGIGSILLSPFLTITQALAEGPHLTALKIRLTPEQAEQNVRKLLAQPQIIEVYSKITEILKPMGMPIDLLIALDLTETGTMHEVESTAGAQGPMQVMPGTVKLYNTWLADNKEKKPKNWRIATSLLGAEYIDWDRINDIDYGRRAGAAIAYLKWYNLRKVFQRNGLVYDEKEQKWKFQRVSKTIKPYPYLSTAALCAAYNGRGEETVLNALKKYGPVPYLKNNDSDKKRLYYDPKQKIGWLDGAYNGETKGHFVRLWRYFAAVQKFKESHPQIWLKIEPGVSRAPQAQNRFLPSFISVLTGKIVSKRQDIGKQQISALEEAI